MKSKQLSKFKQEAKEVTGWKPEINSLQEIKEWQRREVSLIQARAEEQIHAIDKLAEKYLR